MMLNMHIFSFLFDERVFMAIRPFWANFGII